MAQDLRLVSLRLRNFKGIREFALDAQGGDTSVYGDNATGKTTLDDAFNWLLFDKDSANRKDFDIKTIGPDGQPIHNLEHEVEGTLCADGREITLRKVFKEKWTKKRGSATAEFSGHTTDYYVDGVPVSKAEYTQRVAGLADESTFRLLTDPRYFNEQLHWQERRKILLEVCGDVSDAEVIASSQALTALPEILGNRSLEDHRKVIAARRKEINQELDRIPVRIDEATRALPDAEGDKKVLTAEIDRLTNERQARASELVQIDNGGQVVELQKQVREMEIDMLTLTQKLREGSDRAAAQERATLAAVSDRADSLRREIRRMQLEEQDTDRQIESLQTRLADLRRAWYAVNDREFTVTVDEVCPACGQALPTDQVEGARQRAMAEFNARQSAELEANVAEGKRLKGQLDQYVQTQRQRLADIEKAKEQLAQLDAEIVRIQERIAKLRDEAPDPTQDPGYQRLVAAKAELEQQIATLREGTAGAKQRVNAEIADLDAKLSALRGEVARIDQRQQGLARIVELKGQEKRLAAEFERLEQELYLAEECIRTKVRLLEERINSQFQYARFKLFDTQINGGLTECCETLYQGVPYSTSLNSGARTNVGLDIINTLSEHYGFTAPIWIDNSEAVTHLIPVRAQVIRLVVSEADKRLRVVIDSASALQKEAV